MPDSGEKRKRPPAEPEVFSESDGKERKVLCLNRCGVDTGCQFLIQQVQSAAGIAGKLFYLGNEIPGTLFLLGLFAMNQSRKRRVR